MIERYEDHTTGTKAAFARVARFEVWGQWLGVGDTPDWPHPHGRRWGVSAQPGGVTIYAGRLAVTLSRVMQRRAYAPEQATAPI